ncbi:hypothetical protein [Paenibacillus dakarensis]|uniref:hypothetical protein n=1 Tax=Paenibacillus dakarensis TaxID=1527293 RepID=UPI0006D5AA29|nr:hypothetical protein [Paenibacillus dakarensis]
MTLPNIALTGRLRSGKNAVADYLTANYGYTQFAFGDALKRHYHDIFGETETKPREGYQSFGQFCRQYDPEIWLRKCFDFIAAFKYAIDSGVYTPWPNAVITDLRQPNEFDRCRAEGYAIIRITAPEWLRIDRAVGSKDTFTLAELTHDTESHVDTFAVDYEIVNDGTLAELYAKIDAIIAEISRNDSA